MDTNIYKWFNLFGMILNNLTKTSDFLRLLSVALELCRIAKL